MSPPDARTDFDARGAKDRRRHGCGLANANPGDALACVADGSADRKDLVESVCGARDDVHTDEFPDAPRRRGAGVSGRLDRRDVYGRNENGDLFDLLRDPQQPLLMLADVKGLRELGSARSSRRKKPLVNARRRKPRVSPAD